MAPTIQELYRDQVAKQYPAPAPTPEEHEWDMDQSLRDALLGFVSAVGSVINAIGPPGDFGHGQKPGTPGRSLENALNTAREIQWAIKENRRLKFAPGLFSAAALSSKCRSVETDLCNVEWPDDVKKCLPAFWRSMSTLAMANQNLSASLGHRLSLYEGGA